MTHHTKAPEGLWPQLSLALGTAALSGLALSAIARGLHSQGIELDFAIFTRSRPEGSHGALMLQGLALSAQIAAGSAALALLLGIPLGLARSADNPVTARLAASYVSLMRNTPLLIILLAFNFGVVPALPGPVREWLYNHRSEIWATIAALGSYTAAFVAEVVRSGVAGVGRGQIEAGRAAGLSDADVTRLVMWPQAVAAMIPPGGSVLMNMAKNSALASQIGVAELFFRGAELQSSTFHGFEAIAGVTIGYLALSGVILLITRAGERLSTPWRKR